MENRKIKSSTNITSVKNLKENTEYEKLKIEGTCHFLAK